MTLLKEKHGEYSTNCKTNQSPMDCATSTNLQPQHVELPENRTNAPFANDQRAAGVRSIHQRPSTETIERLNAFTSAMPSVSERSVWFGQAQALLEMFFAEAQDDTTLEGLSKLAHLRRPALLPTVENLEEQLASTLHEVWNLVYLLRRLNDSAEISVDWLSQQTRKCVRRYLAIRKQSTHLACEIVLRHPNKQ